jgi:NAD(P)-dependent dehydrogenase (short-subunit alcohol dehydrogenase family)
MHVQGTFLCTREALRRMEDRRSGVILNIASVAGILGLPGAVDYTAAKGAIIAMTKSLSQEVVAAGIRVNAIAPGWIDTPLVGREVDPTAAVLAHAGGNASDGAPGGGRGLGAAPVLRRGGLYHRADRPAKWRYAHVERIAQPGASPGCVSDAQLSETGSWALRVGCGDYRYT